jgi:hypothetical protein
MIPHLIAVGTGSLSRSGTNPKSVVREGRGERKALDGNASFCIASIRRRIAYRNLMFLWQSVTSQPLSFHRCPRAFVHDDAQFLIVIASESTAFLLLTPSRPAWPHLRHRTHTHSSGEPPWSFISIPHMTKQAHTLQAEPMTGPLGIIANALRFAENYTHFAAMF